MLLSGVVLHHGDFTHGTKLRILIKRERPFLLRVATATEVSGVSVYKLRYTASLSLHNGLVNKTPQLGYSVSIVQMVGPFVQDRKQCVNLGMTCSDYRQLEQKYHKEQCWCLNCTVFTHRTFQDCQYNHRPVRRRYDNSSTWP